MKVDVASSYAAGLRAVEVSAPSGWTPTAGRLVLFRDPTSGEGFVTEIIGYATGPHRITAQLEVAIDTDWDVLPVVVYWPSCRFATMDPGEPAGTGSNTHRPEITYSFESMADPVFATAHRATLT